METDSPRLVGFEIDRRLVRAIVLSSDGAEILAYADSSVMEPGAHDEAFPNPGPAISSIWHKLQLAQYKSLRVAASFGFRHAGVGSGGSMAGWVDAMAAQLDEPIAVVAHADGGMSYAPKTHIEIVREGFQWVGCELDAIELAPISAARTLAFRPSGVMRIGSGVAWQVRIHDGSVLEALPYSGGVTRSGVYVEFFGQSEEALPAIHGVDVPAELLESQQLTVGTLAVTVGAAVGLLDPNSVGNFCPHLEKSESKVGTAQAWTTETTSGNDGPSSTDADVDIDLTSPESSVIQAGAGPSSGLTERVGQGQATAGTSEPNEESSPGVEADLESNDLSAPVEPTGTHEEDQKLVDVDAGPAEVASPEAEHASELVIGQSESGQVDAQAADLVESGEVESEVAELVESGEVESEVAELVESGEVESEVAELVESGEVELGEVEPSDIEVESEVAELVESGEVELGEVEPSDIEVESDFESVEVAAEYEEVSESTPEIANPVEPEISADSELEDIETEGQETALDEPGDQFVDEVDALSEVAPVGNNDAEQLESTADNDSVDGGDLESRDVMADAAEFEAEGVEELVATADEDHSVEDLGTAEAGDRGANEPSGEDSEASFDETVSEVEESETPASTGPPMPDENFAQVPVDASTTATMAAIPPPIPPQRFDPDEQPTSNGNSNGAHPGSGHSGEGEPKQNRQVPLVAWSNDEFNGKTETAHEATDPEPELSIPPADPIETQPVPPLDGIRIKPTVDETPTPDVSSTEWQPFGPPQVVHTEADQSPGLVQPRYADEGIDRGIESPKSDNVGSAEELGSDQNVRDAVTIEPSASLLAKMPPAPTPAMASNAPVPSEQFGEMAPQGEDTQPRYDSPGLETGNLALSKPVIHSETAELTVTGAVPVEKAAAHLEAQLDAEEAELSPLAASEVRSIQQPGPRREVKQSRKMWPILLVGLILLIAVAAVLYVWQIGI